MSTTARLSLIGMYNYDSTIFDDLVLPDLYDKADFINSLLLSQGEKRVLYADLDFMRLSIQVWGKKWFDNLERIAEVMTAEYNPLHNYDRFEAYTDTENYGSKRSTESHTGHKGTLTNSPSYSSEETVSAMNSSNYEPDRKTTISGKNIDQSSGDTFNGSGLDNETRNSKIVHDAHLYGNIGVTTSVQMLLEEVNARAYNNIYDIASEIFARELLLYVY